MIIVLDPSVDFAGEIAEVLSDRAVVHVDRPDGVAAAVGGQSCVVIVGPQSSIDESLDAVTGLVPRCGLVVVVSRLLTKVMRAAMHAGASDVLTAGSTTDELRDAVERAEAGIGSTMAAAQALVEASVPTQPAARGKVITVFSTKGGSGKSVVATNLAVGLAGRGHATCVVDLDLQFGDVAIMLQLRPDVTIHDAVALGDGLAPIDLENHLELHESGVAVLCAPVLPSQADRISGPAVDRLLEMLAERFDYIVVDTPAQFTDPVLAAIDVSERIVLLGNLDVPSIKNLRLGLTTLQQLGVAPESTTVIMNRANTKVGLRMSEVERSLGVDVAIELPSDRDVVISLNHGIPITIEHPRSAVSVKLGQLVDIVVGGPAAGSSRRSRAPRRRRVRPAAVTSPASNPS